MPSRYSTLVANHKRALQRILPQDRFISPEVTVTPLSRGRYRVNVPGKHVIVKQARLNAARMQYGTTPASRDTSTFFYVAAQPQRSGGGFWISTAEHVVCGNPRCRRELKIQYDTKSVTCYVCNGVTPVAGRQESPRSSRLGGVPEEKHTVYSFTSVIMCPPPCWKVINIVGRASSINCPTCHKLHSWTVNR